MELICDIYLFKILNRISNKNDYFMELETTCGLLFNTLRIYIILLCI